MEYAETLKWTGVYLGLWLLAGLLAGIVVVVGIAIGGLAGLGAYQLTPLSLRLALYPTGGLVVIALGLVVFKAGSTAALVHVVVGATEDRVASGLDTESLKSDILSVLDERLAEMHADLREAKRALSQGAGNDEGFEFE